MTQSRDFTIEPSKLVYTIGRNEDSEIYLNSPQVSRFHAQLNVLGDSSLEIEDLDSKYRSDRNPDFDSSNDQLSRGCDSTDGTHHIYWKVE